MPNWVDVAGHRIHRRWNPEKRDRFRYASVFEANINKLGDNIYKMQF